jgi:hypothetical protein
MFVPDPVVKKAPDAGSGSATLEKLLNATFCKYILADIFLQRTLEKLSSGGEREYFSKNIHD